MTAAIILAAAALIGCSSQGSEQEMSACVVREQARANIDLAEAYKRALAFALRDDAGLDRTIDKRIGYRDALVRSQKAWIAYRDAQCLNVAYTLRGGSGEAEAQGQCLLDFTQNRIRELRQLDANQEDLAPNPPTPPPETR